MEKMKNLFEVAETPLQIEILAKAIRVSSLMADQPYYRAGEKGVIYEVTPDGKPLSPIILAIRMGAPAEKVKLLLQERERQVLEWRSQKQNNSDTNKKVSEVE